MSILPVPDPYIGPLDMWEHEREMIEAGVLRICSRCRASLPFYMFHKDASKPSGTQAYCKECKTLWRQER